MQRPVTSALKFHGQINLKFAVVGYRRIQNKYLQMVFVLNFIPDVGFFPSNQENTVHNVVGNIL